MKSENFFKEENRVFIAVYEIPNPMVKGYCFGTGVSIVFQNVDWFTAPIEEKEETIKFIKTKKYYNPSKRYLVLSRDGVDGWDFTF